MFQATYMHVMFRGILNETDDDDMDIAEFDTQAFSLQPRLKTLGLNRDPMLETEYFGINNEFELHFKFRTSWMDRDSDIEDYLDKVQEEIENGLNVIIWERENLGYTRS